MRTDVFSRVKFNVESISGLAIAIARLYVARNMSFLHHVFLLLLLGTSSNEQQFF